MPRVERPVVRDHHPATQAFGNVACDRVERWGVADIGGVYPVDPLWAEVTFRVEQRGPFVGDNSARIGVDDRDLGDAVLHACNDAGRFSVDDGEAGVFHLVSSAW